MWKPRWWEICPTIDTNNRPRLPVRPYLLQTGVSLNRPGVILPRCAPIGTFNPQYLALRLPTNLRIWEGTVLKQRLLNRRPPVSLRFNRACLASDRLGWVEQRLLLIRKHLRL